MGTLISLTVALVITDFDYSPDEIGKVLELEPTRTWRQGERVLPVATNVHKQNGWLLQSPADHQSAGLDVHIDALMRLIRPKLGRFDLLPSGSQIELSCRLKVYGDERPALHFSPETIKLLASIGAALDIDLYHLPEDALH